MFSKDSYAIVQNLKPKYIQGILDFDFMCGRDPSIKAIVHNRRGFHKAFYGGEEILIPIYPSLKEALEENDADVLINFASYRSAYAPSKEALESEKVRTVVLIAEGIPEREMKDLIRIAGERNKLIIGPATVGAIRAGEFRAGLAGGDNANLLRCKLYRPGRVGLVTKSGGMLNEMMNIISRAAGGVREAVAIGGDVFPGSRLIDHVLRMESDGSIDAIVVLGEIGGKEEYEIVKALEEGRVKKPLIAWVSGTCAGMFSWDVQFGHAAAKAGKEEESAKAKNEALKKAGAHVPGSFEELEQLIAKVAGQFKDKIVEREPNIPPMDYKEALKKGVVRKERNFTCTVSDDRGEEPTFNKKPISTYVEEGSIGKVIANLWFKKDLPDYFVEFVEKAMIVLADHGPAVSGAHNAIVASRAGKDVISSLCSGLLTIGPRFGGAIDDAARVFKRGFEENIDPHDLVEEMKREGKRVPGIGHRVKSKRNPDKRVEILKAFARERFPETSYLDYALRVEEATLQKSEKLILNVDGCIAALFLDALKCSGFSKEEMDEIIEIGYMNGLFALSRSIGFIAHILDQKRLKEGLYRHPTDDILYL